MRLVELHPHWVGAGGEGITDSTGHPVPERYGIGVSFDCPCEKCAAQRTGNELHDFMLRVFVPFKNPLDGQPPPTDSYPLWERTGETFDTLVLSPSILHNKDHGCGWHGFIGGTAGNQPGEVVTV